MDGERAVKVSRSLWMPAVALGLVALLWMGGDSASSLKTVIAARFPDVQRVDSATLSRWMKQAGAAQPVLLDARTKAEFAVSHLQGARRVDPDKPKISALRVAPDATVVVYCSVGYRSADIAQQIQRTGIGKVYNLEGGIFVWANEGRPIYRDDKRVKLVHPYDGIWGLFLHKDLRAPLSKKQ